MRAIVLLAALALALVGCGGDGESQQQGSAARSPGASAPATESAASETPGPAVADTTDATALSEESEQAGEAASQAPAATLWVTREAGSELLVEAKVAVGATVIQALGGAAEIETRYSGRYVTSIEGVEAEPEQQRDWFFLVNGIEPDVGAAEVKVGDGDVIWWDHRGWVDGGAHPAIAVGAFPHPFHHGWKGAVRPVEVIAPTELAETAASLQAFLSSESATDADAEPHRFVLEVRPELAGAELTATMGQKNSSPVTFLLAGDVAALKSATETLIADPAAVARRYTATFDENGKVAGS